MKKHLSLVLAIALAAPQTFAAPDFDNSDIPAGANVSFWGGCGTVVKFEPVTNIKPRYTDRYPEQGQLRNVGSGGEIAQVLGAIPGVGFIAAIVAGAATAIVANAAIDDANKQIDAAAVKEQKWEKVYLLTVKPDFGEEYTVPYEKLNQRTPEAGSRVLLTADALNTNGWMYMRFSFMGDKDTGEIGSEQYLETCYRSFGKGGKNPYKFRQLSYNGTEFEWRKLDPKIQPSADAYFAKKAAEEARKKADAEDAAKYNNDSR